MAKVSIYICVFLHEIQLYMNGRLFVLSYCCSYCFIEVQEKGYCAILEKWGNAII